MSKNQAVNLNTNMCQMIYYFMFWFSIVQPDLLLHHLIKYTFFDSFTSFTFYDSFTLQYKEQNDYDDDQKCKSRYMLGQVSETRKFGRIAGINRVIRLLAIIWSEVRTRPNDSLGIIGKSIVSTFVLRNLLNIEFLPLSHPY